MDPVTTTLGVLALLYGVFSAIMRFIKPEFFSKLEPMQEKYGDALGNTIHMVSYVLVPLGLGIALIIAGLNGVSFFAPK